MDYNKLNLSNLYQSQPYDLVVVGAGHAGCEAAIAVAKMGFTVLLTTMYLDGLANMPCNPNIGGTAKGQLVREIDALGGVMGRIADQNILQLRRLNASKGPAVISTRAQIDRTRYQRTMKHYLESVPGLDLYQGEVQHLVWRAKEQEVASSAPSFGSSAPVLSSSALDSPSPSASSPSLEVAGVLIRTLGFVPCQTVLLATGTFLNAAVIVGDEIYPSGPDGLAPSTDLAADLHEAGLLKKRFKTGTPVRIKAESIDFDQLQIQGNDDDAQPFSMVNRQTGAFTYLNRLSCYLTWTSLATKKIIQDNLDRSPLYSGKIKGIGPRYCPSIEDKVVKFPSHDRHHIFLEPTGNDTQEYYASGFSSSMPADIQMQMLHTLQGLEHAKVMRMGYAIEYDLIDPTDLYPTLESKLMKNLYCAGQINGSSGYEEAAAQGLVAGINIGLALQDKDPFFLKRSESYIGVLIDDLVSKGTNEPYRMMTARAEYRLVLREDNADLRLLPYGRSFGLIDDETWHIFQQRQQIIQHELDRLRQTRYPSSPALAAFLEKYHSAPVEGGIVAAYLLRRPEISYQAFREIDPDFPQDILPTDAFTIETELKYAGYIAMESKRIDQFNRQEKIRIPQDFDFSSLDSLRLEARQKLSAMRPQTLGQASRISGVSPADIAVLAIALKAQEGRHRRPSTEVTP